MSSNCKHFKVILENRVSLFFLASSGQAEGKKSVLFQEPLGLTAVLRGNSSGEEESQ